MQSTFISGFGPSDDPESVQAGGPDLTPRSASIPNTVPNTTLTARSAKTPHSTPELAPSPPKGAPPARRMVRPGTPAQPKTRQEDCGSLASKLDALSLEHTALRQDYTNLSSDVQSRLADLECAAGRIDAAFAQLSGLHALIRGRDRGSYRGNSNSNYGDRGGHRGRDRGGHRQRGGGTPPPGRLNPFTGGRSSWSF